MTNQRREIDAYFAPGDDAQSCEIKMLFESGDIKALVSLLRSNEPLTCETRLFIADYIDGKIPRKTGKPKDIHRDLEIFEKVTELCKAGHPLRDSVSKEGATSIVAEMYGLTDEAVMKVYQKLLPAMNIYEENQVIGL
jgi:hypothetical protein